MDFIMIVITITISLIAHLYVTANFSKYKNNNTKSELSGFEVARKILDNHDMNDVYITAISGKYSDYYNSVRKVVKLSKNTFNGSSVTYVSIAAFEATKAVYDKKNDSLFKFKEMFTNIFKYLSYLGYVLIIAGIFLAIPMSVTLGIVFEMVNLLFHLFTIKVEINIARSALDELLEISAINSEENEKVKSVLAACAYKNLACLINNILEVGTIIYDFGSSK